MRENRTSYSRHWRMALVLALATQPIHVALGDYNPPPPPWRLEAARDPRRLSDDLKVELKLREPKAEFQQLERIPLEVFVKNLASTTARRIGGGYNPLSEYRNVLLRVYDAEGDLMPMTRYQSGNAKYGDYPIGGGFGFSDPWEMPVGTGFRSYPVANLAYDLSSPGEYSILAEFPTGQTREVAGVRVPVVAQSQVLKVRILDKPSGLDGGPSRVTRGVFQPTPPPSRLEAACDPRRLSDDLKVEVKLREPKADFKQLEPIPLEVFVKNLAGTKARTIGGSSVPPLSAYRYVMLRVYNARGDLMRVTRYQTFDADTGHYSITNGPLPDSRVLPVGSEFRLHPVANLAYDMSSPGEYSIIAEFPTGETREVAGVWVPVVAQSQVLKVRILADLTRWPFP